MNFRQRQVKEALTALNRQSNILIKIRTKVCSNRKENTFYENYYSNGISSIKLGMPKEKSRCRTLTSKRMSYS